MLSKEKIEEFNSKSVHVDYVDANGKLIFIEGVFSYELFTNEVEDTCEEFVDITSGTDFVRIPMTDIRKIYPKKEF